MLKQCQCVDFTEGFALRGGGWTGKAGPRIDYGVRTATHKGIGIDRVLLRSIYMVLPPSYVPRRRLVLVYTATASFASASLPPVGFAGLAPSQEPWSRREAIHLEIGEQALMTTLLELM